jgi:hypothetical protein
MSERPGLFDFAGQRTRTKRLWEAITWDEVALFAGPNAGSFRGAFERTRPKMLAGHGGVSFGFCWPAFLFSFAWFFYRKMWAAGLALLLVPPALGYFIDSRGGAIGVLVAISLFAKSLYVQHAVWKIGGVRERGGDDEAVAAHGGVSLAGGAVGGLILAAAGAAAVYLFMEGVR